MSERLLGLLPSGVIILDAKHRILWFNRAVRELLGPRALDFLGRDLASLEHPDDRALSAYLSDSLPTFAAESYGTYDSPSLSLDDIPQAQELDLYSASRIYRGLTNVQLLAGDEPVRVDLKGFELQAAGIASDLVLLNVVRAADKSREVQKLQYLASHDDLTGLANRRGFQQACTRQYERIEDSAPTGSLLLLDLDGFKKLNDTLGHAVGDRLLVAAARLFTACATKEMTVARIGGDEFAILIPYGGRAEAESVARTIVNRAERDSRAQVGTTGHLTVSIGAATFKDAVRQGQDIYAMADSAMYLSKRAERSCYTIYPGHRDKEAAVETEVTARGKLVAALEADAFQVLLQPIVELRTGAVVAGEVLIQMFDGNRTISPAAFIPVAERAGLMPELDSWVVDLAFSTLGRLLSVRPDFKIAVNLSGVSVGNEDVERIITGSAQKHRVPPSSVILEVTESAAIVDLQRAVACLTRLSDRGFLIAIDDFGTGFGSLRYLKQLPHNLVKLAGEFVVGAPHYELDRAFLRHMVEVVKTLGVPAVAEHVSSPEVLAVVREFDIEYAQGHLFGEPVPIEHFVRAHLYPDNPPFEAMLVD